MTTLEQLVGAVGARLQALVDSEAAVEGAASILRVELPRRGLVWQHVAGGITRGGEPAAVTTPFRIASVTKPFTAAVVMQLVAEGKLALDDLLSSRLPADHLDLVPRVHVLDGVSYGERITIRQMLSHASGLFDYAMSPSFGQAIGADPGHVWTPREMVEGAIAWGTPHFPPGEGYGYAYSDTGYVLAGLVIEAIEGRPLHEAYRARILDPLGLGNTYLEGFEAHRGSEMAHAHEGQFDAAPIHGSADWAGGGLVSDTADLATFVQALLAGDIVPEPCLAEMLDWQFRALDPAKHTPGYLGYGLGVDVRESNGFLLRGHRGHWGVLMHRDPLIGLTITGTINQADRRPEALMHGATAAIRESGVTDA
ncbi:MAG: beta-lactamase family protein [Ilumatobacteraceae bacterium]|nr:beta-lactamase family protein [Ilumatobacteraceae bacterium]